jgi:prepilin-type N-terminal cleavage/methylation domain-containing protein
VSKAEIEVFALRLLARKQMGANRGVCGNRGGFTLIELLVVVVVVAVLVGIAMPSFVRIKDKAKEAEAKANLHNIQLVLERFAVDNSATYPEYLIGGEPRFAQFAMGADGEPGHVYGEVPIKQCSDPLIRKGYVATYPKNPFVRNGSSVEAMQKDVGDPLRSSMKDGQLMGTRFGANGNIMGQVLCDARYLKWVYFNDITGEPIYVDSWTNVQYNFFDVWMGNLQKPYLPGSFMYKSMGDLMLSGEDAREGSVVVTDGNAINTAKGRKDEATIPMANTQYVLGVWGGSRTKGMDILGEEPLVVFTFKNRSSWGTNKNIFVYNDENGIYEPPKPGESDQIKLLGIPSWTRGVNRAHIGPLWGSPYGPSLSDEKQLEIGNPNGMKDAIILILNSGEN